jgi:hypothetical protein
MEKKLKGKKAGMANLLLIFYNNKIYKKFRGKVPFLPEMPGKCFYKLYFIENVFS